MLCYSTEYANDVSLLGERFTASYRFKVIDPQSSMKLPKDHFWRKATPFKILLRKYSVFIWTLIYVFLLSLAEVGKAEMTKQLKCAVFITKKVDILPLCLGLLERSRQKFYRITPSRSPSLCQVLCKSVLG